MPQDVRYRIEGVTPLRGEVALSGAKNAALPCMCAALLTKEEVTLRNVPDIEDVRALLGIFSFLGVQHSFDGGALTIGAERLECREIPHEFVCKLRASILLLGPLLARCGEVTMAYPGGCVLGKRPVDAHIDALVQLGIEDRSTDETLRLRGTVRGGEIVLPEFSVTATENVLLAAAAAGAEVTVRIAAAEPHVQDLCRCLASMGARIGGVGTHDLVIGGVPLHGGEHTITTDYLEAGFFALAGVLTGGDLRVRGARDDQLRSFLKAMAQLGAPWEFVDGTDGDSSLRIHGGSPLRACHIKTNVFPGFPTDLQAGFGVAMTQASGVSRIFERLYEGRQGYLYELEKMGAHVEILNPREALIIGPTPLRGRTVTSNDIRAGTAMVLAALCARGETLITDVQYIERGYERLEEKLRSVGAAICREPGRTVEMPEGDQVDSARPSTPLRTSPSATLPSSTFRTNAQDPITRRPDAPVWQRAGVAARVP